jgi:hypothetical protein
VAQLATVAAAWSVKSTEAGADAAMPFMQGGSMVCGRARSSCDGGGVSPIDGGLADDDPGGTGPSAHPLALQGDADSSLGLSRGCRQQPWHGWWLGLGI